MWHQNAKLKIQDVEFKGVCTFIVIGIGTGVGIGVGVSISIGRGSKGMYN